MLVSYTPTHTTILLMYIDGNVVIGNDSPYLKELILFLIHNLHLRTWEHSFFLGIVVKRYTKGLHLSQHKYIQDLL